MRFKSLLGVCVISFCMGAGAQTTVSIAPDAASKEDVQKLFDVMASRDQMAQMMQKVFAQMRTLNRDEIKKRHPDITAAQLASMDRQSEELLKNFPLDEMLSDMIPVYQRHFTKTEIDSFTSFFSSP
ncbi:MAG: DUF2059 domain-containing protein, partial [Candidatus Sulfotelmatobacter sp.]